MNGINYYFAKVNVEWNIFTSNQYFHFKKIKLRLFPKLILSFRNKNFAKVYYYDKYHQAWTIKDVKRINNDIITGNLDKVAKTPYNTIQDTSTVHKVADDAYKAKFYYYINNEILVFQSTKEIKYTKFPDMFYNVLSKIDENNITAFNIQLLTHVSHFQQDVIRVPIKDMHFTLVPPNDVKSTPFASRILNISGSQKANIDFLNKNKKKGLNITNNGKVTKFFKNLFESVKRGWGSVLARDFSGRTYSNKKYPIRYKINKKNNHKLLDKKVNNIDEERKRKETKHNKK